jgi:hypothetical protein
MTTTRYSGRWRKDGKSIRSIFGSFAPRLTKSNVSQGLGIREIFGTDNRYYVIAIIPQIVIPSEKYKPENLASHWVNQKLDGDQFQMDGLATSEQSLANEELSSQVS